MSEVDIINQPAMGIGKLGGPAVLLRHNRNSKFTAEGEFPDGKFGPYWVRLPTIPYPEDKKTKFTLLDVHNESTKTLFVIMSKSLGFMPTKNGSQSEVVGTVVLKKYDGSGKQVWTMKLREAKFTGVQFVEVDHSATESSDIDLGIQFNSLDVEVL